MYTIDWRIGTHILLRAVLFISAQRLSKGQVKQKSLGHCATFQLRQTQYLFSEAGIITRRLNNQSKESVSGIGSTNKSRILSQRARPLSPLTYWLLNQQGQSMFDFLVEVPELGSDNQTGQSLQQPRQYFLQLQNNLDTSSHFQKGNIYIGEGDQNQSQPFKAGAEVTSFHTHSNILFEHGKTMWVPAFSQTFRFTAWMTRVSEPTGQLRMFIQLLAHPRAFVRAEITRQNIKRCNINAKYVCGEWVLKMGTKDIHLESFYRQDAVSRNDRFFYYNLPTTANSQEHPRRNICWHNILYIIIINLAKAVTANIAPGQTAEKHCSFPCKEYSI